MQLAIENFHNIAKDDVIYVKPGIAIFKGGRRIPFFEYHGKKEGVFKHYRSKFPLLRQDVFEVLMEQVMANAVKQ